MKKYWKDFSTGKWTEEINVSDFIVQNFTTWFHPILSENINSTDDNPTLSLYSHPHKSCAQVLFGHYPL